MHKTEKWILAPFDPFVISTKYIILTFTVINTYNFMNNPNRILNIILQFLRDGLKPTAYYQINFIY